MAKIPKTKGYEWLELSVISFNGSGYADMSSPGAFLDSYRQYKLWKRMPNAVALLDKYWWSIMKVAEHLVENSEGAGRIPSQRRWQKFNDFKNGRLRI